MNDTGLYVDIFVSGLEASESHVDEELPAAAASIVMTAGQFSEMLLEEKEVSGYRDVA